MAEQIGLCLVGAGAIAERHLQALDKLSDVSRRWLVSQPADQAQQFAERWQFARFATAMESALADETVQLVLIASPSPLHSQQAIQALEAGEDVVVEIPVGLSWAEARQVASTAEKLRRRVWVCHTLRSTPALRLVRERLRSGELHLTHISGFFGIPRRRNQGMDGIGTRTWIDNLLWHHGCHQVDASLWVLDMPPVTRVQALLGPNHPTLAMELDVGLQFVTGNGTLMTHSLSYNVQQPVWQLQFIGHEDVLTFLNGRLTNEAGQEWVPETPTSNLTVQDGELLHAFRTGQSSEYDLSSVLATMDVLGRAQQSASSYSDAG